MVKKLRNIVATIWNEQEKAEFVKLCNQYYIIGKESCPTTKRMHYQCYGEFKGQISFEKIKKLMPTAHIEARKGTVMDAVMYCKKDGDFLEVGEPKRQGAREDLATVKAMATSGASVRDIILQLEEPNYQAIRTAEKLVEYLRPERTCKPYVRWFWGETGSGKTRKAVELAEAEVKDNYWMSMDSLQWWDGYDGQKFIIIDDFRADFCKFHTLLRYLDRYNVRVPVKGGYRQLLATNIIITSPFPPDEVYRSREDVKQLLRRIDDVVQFGPQEMISHFSEVEGNTILDIL